MTSNVVTPTATRFIEVDGVRVGTRSYGGGLPLLMLNRFRGTMDSWDPVLVTSLARQHRVIVFDSLGVGESGGDVPPSVETMADFAAAVMRTLGVESADILGWSIGGFLAQVLALKSPRLIRKLILAATTAPAGAP